MGENGPIRAPGQACVLLPVPLHRAVVLVQRGIRIWRCKACSFPAAHQLTFLP